ncbi:transporter substrate-binding domain-containing protein [Fusobacterium sp.]|uniref:transporter substrate-binding domain-containing protein n=1 Tax=Fusobacterium sp. TaxID=68766 RepID=UPI0028FDE510|nr:transporter substrate-binding domain-containing protein [Fusobacterium sp.]MDU1912414.1 transporter substrate-binding domain-containing protein [Fusobacterium sp.]
MKKVVSLLFASILMVSLYSYTLGGEKVYKIATDTTYAPFEFENDKGELVGIDMDLMKAIANDQKFKYDVEVVGFSAALTSMETGQSDGVIAGMTITEERKEKYDFSVPYFDTGVSMGVKIGSAIKSYEDLKGKKVAAKISTVSCKYAESIADKYGFEIVYFEDSTSMFQDVLLENSVACFEDFPVLGYEISRGLGLKMPLGIEQPASYGLAVMKGMNKDLLESFNKGLSNLKDSGEYQKILDRYISK